MCVVSMVMDQWWPTTVPRRVPDQSIPWPVIQEDPALAKSLLEIIHRLESIDKRLGQLERCSVTVKKKAAIKRKLSRIAKSAKERPTTTIGDHN